MGGQAWITPAFVISDSLWSLLSHRTLQLDYHSKIESEWNEFHHCRLRGYWNLNLFFSFMGNIPTLQRGREGMEKFAAGFLLKVVVPLKLFHLCLTFHPGNLPVSLCLCFDSLSMLCNLFCSERGTGMTARVSTQLINNDQIHHSPVWEVTLLLTR